VVEAVTLPPVPPTLLKRESSRPCLPDGAESYTVPELEEAHGCEAAGRRRARVKLHRLQDAIQEREAVARRATAVTS